ncbi:TonB-dependent receptor [Flavobacterium columnare]|uniref:outer membrane beta-barrel protein n=1 Tax=Flavobacterium columnare TaxID=996 RepID=UPI0009820C08|nr:outer membrane beta-barrel protein [Flavobacterium columnare]MBF6651551.1 TonB-dependent receptor [Flavobacterium columnare]MBF6655863.1 TonB-dependent receptor [Flavobacterium columnare]OOB82577.1 TonB-dependent receptor [Flavobacterium columnare]QOG88672.1 TonB-dependent receptor [Flavobacterium columnare]QOG91331.1 TonB-dependent receptor [Flavobacterium columnare]
MKTTKFTLLLFSFLSFATYAQENKDKTNELKEVAIVKEKKAVEQRSDRTIFELASQAHLNSGSVLEGMKKLPGLVASDVAGMMYQGKQLDVFLDGRPLAISTNELNAFLEGLPANSVEKIEVITNPGAEFPATSGGAILNIVTNKRAKNYLTATYTNSSSFTSYSKNRWRTNNSILLSSKNKFFGWQLNFGQNYAERGMWSEVLKKEDNLSTLLTSSSSDRILRTLFAKTGLTFDIGKNRLLLNYDIYSNNNTSATDAMGLLPNSTLFSTIDDSKTLTLRQDAVATYQMRFLDSDKKLDFKFNFNSVVNDFNLFSRNLNRNTLSNGSDQRLYNFKIDYNQSVKLLEEGKISIGTLYEELYFNTFNKNVNNLEYRRMTASTYAELQTKYKKFEFTLGLRGENYDISGKTETQPLIPFKQYRLFPNGSIQYSLANKIILSGSYNKKITLPSTSSLNPNNTNYQNPNVGYLGNPQLQPTLFNNYEFKLSVFEYAFVGYNISEGLNQVAQRMYLNGNRMVNTNENISSMKIHTFNLGLPIPYMLFTKGLKETAKFNFNPDKINFMFLYAGRQKHDIPNADTNAFWIFNIMSQVVLPGDIKWVTNYSHITKGGNYFYFVAQRPFNHSLDMTFSKKFLSNQLTVSVNVDDVFNFNKSSFNSLNTPLYMSNKNDTRRIGFTLNYKIPTKNKIAKEDPNMLNKEKKEDNGTLIVN